MNKDIINLDNKTILVTGAAGFIGSYLCKRLLDTTKDNVIGIDKVILIFSHTDIFNFVKFIPSNLLYISYSIFSQFAFGFLVSSFRVYGALISINGALMQYAPLFFGLSQIIFGPIWGIINDKFQSFKIRRNSKT